MGRGEGRKLRSHSTEGTLRDSGDWRGGWGRRGGRGAVPGQSTTPSLLPPGRAGHPGHREGGLAAVSQPRRQNGLSRDSEGMFGGVRSWKAVGCEGCCLPERGICPKDCDIPARGPCGWEMRATWGFPRRHWCGREARAPSPSSRLSTMSSPPAPGTGSGQGTCQDEGSCSPIIWKLPSRWRLDMSPSHPYHLQRDLHRNKSTHCPGRLEPKGALKPI